MNGVTRGPAGDHISDEELARFNVGEMGDEEFLRIETHLCTCVPCASRHAPAVAEGERLINCLRHAYENALSDITHSSSNHLPQSFSCNAKPPRSSCVDGTADLFSIQWSHVSEPELPPSSTPQIAGYAALELIFSGGQGVVYHATQLSTGRQVAIKLMREGPFAGSADRARFEREIRILAQLRHPDIVTIHDSGVCPSGHYFIMDYVPGHSLDEYWAQAKSANDKCRERILGVFVRICEAVQAAHVRGIIHRDLKPRNIRIERDGSPKILDFGLARSESDGRLSRQVELTVTEPGQFVGTLPWASPEQAEGRPTDMRADVYALGVMLYQAITGVFPYPVDVGAKELLNNICHAVPEPPSRLARSIHNDLDTIILKCLAKDPPRRYPSARELCNDLSAYLEHRPISARRDSFFYVMGKAVQRHRLVAALTLLTFASVVALAVGMSIQSVRLAKQRDAARSAQRAEQREHARAESESARLRQTVYLQNLALAQGAHEKYQTDQMQHYLEQCPKNLRGWEWTRLAYLVDESSGGGATTSLVSENLPYWLHTRSARTVVPIVSPHGDAYTGLNEKSPGVSIRSLLDSHLIARIDVPNTITWYTFSPDGKEIAYIYLGDIGVQITSLENEPIKIRALAHARPVTACDYSTDGKWLAVVDTAGEVILWNRESQQIAKRVGDLMVAASCVHFSPDDRMLLVGRQNGNLYIYDVETGATRQVLYGHRDIVGAGAWSPDSKRIVSGSQDQTVRVWDVASGECLRILRGHNTYIHSTAFHADGERIASVGSHNNVKFWDLGKRKDVCVWSDTRPVRFGSGSYSPDGTQFAVAASDGNTRIIDISQNKLVSSWKTAQTNANIALFSPDGKKLLTAGTDPGVYLWDSQSHAKLLTLSGHIAGVPCAGFSTDGNLVLTGGWDHTCRIWDANTGRQQLKVQQSDEVWEAEFMPDSDSFLAGGKDGNISLWSAKDGRNLWTKHAHSDAVDALAVSPDGKHFATGGWDGRLVIWDSATRQAIHQKHTHSSRLYCAAFTRDGRRVLTTGKRLIEVWDVTTGDRVYTFEAHSDSIYCLSFSPDNDRLLGSCGADGLLKFWPIGTP